MESRGIDVWGSGHALHRTGMFGRTLRDSCRSATTGRAAGDLRRERVVRGVDHLPNAPKHVALFRALGAPCPVFAHLGMILGADGKKLSGPARPAPEVLAEIVDELG